MTLETVQLSKVGKLKSDCLNLLILASIQKLELENICYRQKLKRCDRQLKKARVVMHIETQL